MKIPQLIEKITSDDPVIESKKLNSLIINAKEKYSIQGIVHGGILSEYQKDNFSLVCKKHHLEIISPLWNKDPESYMKELLDTNFEYIVSTVSSDGLNDSWLGRKISHADLDKLEQLQKKFNFNLKSNS